MADNNYIIYRADNKKNYVVEENGTNVETSITMTGHGKPEYGREQNTNFLHLLENFSNTDEPRNPIRGQLWFKQLGKTSGDTKYELNVCKSENPIEWDKLAIVNNSEKEPTNPESGDMWYDIDTHSFKVYDTVLGKWNVIGPIDIMHKENVNDSRVIESSNNTLQASYQLPFSLFEKDIENENDTKDSSGALSLVTAKILAKEIFNVPTAEKTPRSAAWIYKFLVNSVKTGVLEGLPIYTTSIVGQESYELIGITDDTDWIVDLTVSNGSGGKAFTFLIQDNSDKKLDSTSRIVIGFDIDIVRV